ncbi:GNAT family N-acetyltransferase [Rubinisphaera sp.]|uniref:GNAT family N-acetyltransferase n=1 Tax=Rubinisphaera sp. TaxID=2024857 RepID=UPI000C0C6B4B|nr:GNAT family N-acetyltransferase [Rubinisphaera sp.]MBV09153.1 hypothetical protein [Rubinisphaera sp.]HCS51987.1 hypothetical protein [Planctomycetaceae bacterium]|tara:strand:+ start:6081 stop:6695 length:615 start_codon:yes stop_codon:yes gene_type:complete
MTISDMSYVSHKNPMLEYFGYSIHGSQFRLMEHCDAKFVSDQIEEFYHTEFALPIQDLTDSQTANLNQVTYVSDRSQLIGMARMRHYDSIHDYPYYSKIEALLRDQPDWDCCVLDRQYVITESRNVGVANFLIQKQLQDCLDQNVSQIYVMPIQEFMVDYYKKLGFTCHGAGLPITQGKYQGISPFVMSISYAKNETDVSRSDV